MTILYARSRSVTITDASQVGEVRRLAVGVAEGLGLNATQSGKVAIIATEIGSNILKHARQGKVIVRALENGASRGVEILSLDKGRGMADLHKCLQDGYSTAGSSGTGLGSISRLSTNFDVYTSRGDGTVLWSQVWSKHDTGNEPSRFEVGAVCLPMHEGEGCGDAWSVKIKSDQLEFLMVDGLGHGEFAAAAADEAVRAFEGISVPDLEEQMQNLHCALKKSRGAAVGLGELKGGQQKVRFVGVGNICGCILANDRSQSLVSYNGTVGHIINKAKEFVYDWPRDSLLILHSDGLTPKWDLKQYPGLMVRHPAVIAGVLYRDFHRIRDDASVVVIRETAVNPRQ